MQQFLNQLARMISNRLINRGIGKTIDSATGANARQNTPEQRRQAQLNAKRLRQGIGFLRRFMR